MEASSALGRRVNGAGPQPCGAAGAERGLDQRGNAYEASDEGDRKRKGRHRVSFERFIQTVG